MQLDKQFLKDLNSDPRWQRILESLKRKPPTYSPNDDIEEEKLKSKFVYESGRFKENEKLLTILGVKNDASHD